jgi:hypothetical protein
MCLLLKQAADRPSTPIFLMRLDFFHPAVAAWFNQSFVARTPAQGDAWPAIKGRAECPDRGAHGIGQDARWVLGGHR